MFKLKELKHTFLKNNQNRKNLNDYFNKFANKNKLIEKDELKKIVKEYGYDINDDEASIIFKLTTDGKANHLDISSFVELMGRDNVYFRTLSKKLINIRIQSLIKSVEILRQSSLNS
jgi:Ca2+-binding EF-hand superfamily protein